MHARTQANSQQSSLLLLRHLFSFLQLLGFVTFFPPFGSLPTFLVFVVLLLLLLLCDHLKLTEGKTQRKFVVVVIARKKVGESSCSLCYR